MRNIKIFTMVLIGMFFILTGFGLNAEEGKEIEEDELYECRVITTAFVIENSVNFTHIEQEHEYPVDWNCVNISNAYIINNPEWRSFSFYIECPECKENNVSIGHALNYQIINERFYVHDETWGCEYELEDWRNMSLQLRDYNEMCPHGNRSFYVNVDEY